MVASNRPFGSWKGTQTWPFPMQWNSLIFLPRNKHVMQSAWSCIASERRLRMTRTIMSRLRQVKGSWPSPGRYSVVGSQWKWQRSRGGKQGAANDKDPTHPPSHQSCTGPSCQSIEEKEGIQWSIQTHNHDVWSRAVEARWDVCPNCCRPDKLWVGGGIKSANDSTKSEGWKCWNIAIAAMTKGVYSWTSLPQSFIAYESFVRINQLKGKLWCVIQSKLDDLWIGWSMA